MCSIVRPQAVWPIEERPVPQSDVPGERTSPTHVYDQTSAFIVKRDRRRFERLDAGTKAEAIRMAAEYRLGPLITRPL